jgi:hypothetical protein
LRECFLLLDMVLDDVVRVALLIVRYSRVSFWEKADLDRRSATKYQD